MYLVPLSGEYLVPLSGESTQVPLSLTVQGEWCTDGVPAGVPTVYLPVYRRCTWQ